jgi:predicted aminopeptidase
MTGTVHVNITVRRFTNRKFEIPKIPDVSRRDLTEVTRMEGMRLEALLSVIEASYFESLTPLTHCFAQASAVNYIVKEDSPKKPQRTRRRPGW